MFKSIGIITPRPGMALPEFHRYWREVHGPLALRIQALRRYVQSHRIDTVPGFENCPYHGGAEGWWDTLEVMQGLQGNPEYAEGCLVDEPNFIDMPKLFFLATQEKVIIEGPPIAQNTPLVKAIFLLKRKPDMTVAEFQEYWIKGHAPQIPRDAGVLRYVQCHQVPSTYADGEPPFDGIAELSFADHAAFTAYWTSPRIQDIFAADAPRFLDGAHCTAFLADETRVLWP